MKFIVSKARPRVRFKGLGGRYYKVWSKRGLGDDAISVNSGDVPAPDPTLIAQELGPYGQGIDNPANVALVVEQAVQSQVTADNLRIFNNPPSRTSAAVAANGLSLGPIQQFLKQPLYAGSSIPTGLAAAGVGVLAMIAFVSSGSRRR